MTNEQFIKSQTWRFVLIALFFIAAASFTSCKPVKGQCTFEGAECPNVQHYLRDYQLEFQYDTLKIYDADRLVGTIVDTTEAWRNIGHFIDTTIANDNQ